MSDSTEQAIYDLFQEIARKQPDSVALVHSSERLTYAELRTRAARLARRIQRQVHPGKAVAILLPETSASIVAVLACLAAARISVVLSAYHPAQRNAEILRDAGAYAVILESLDQLPSEFGVNISARILLRNPGDEVELNVDEHPHEKLPPGAPAVVLYTSGSTGRPKGIVLSQRTILSRAQKTTVSSHLSGGERFLSLSALATTAGLIGSIAALLSGATQLLVSISETGTGKLINLMEEHRVSILWGVPSLLRMLFEAEKASAALASLRLVRTYGKPLLGLDLEAWRAKLPGACDFAITYGQTEATIAQWAVPTDFETNSPTLPVGYLSPEFEYAIVDEEQRSVDSGETGELLVRGRCVALGEWERSQCVAGRMRPDHADAESRILPTGDLVRLRPDHLLEVVGRVDRQIKIHGLRVEPAEIENVIRRVPGVTDAAIAVRRAEHDAMLLAFVVGNKAAGDPGLLNRVRTATRNGLPFHMQPGRIHIVERLPTLAGSKIDTQALLELDATALRSEQLSGIRQCDLAEASQRSRQAVKRAWTRTLGRPSFRANITFEAAGGDSLTFLSLIFAIERQLSTTLPLDAFHSQLRPDEFARCVDDCLNGAPNGASPRDSTPVFLFPGGGGDELNLVRFRARCAPAVRVQLLEYGVWQNWLAPDFNLDLLISQAVRQIELRAPEGPISVAGHSLGGHLTYATALELLKAGRTVDFLGILDSEAGMTPSVAFYSNPRADLLSRMCSHLRGGGRIDKAIRALCQRTRRKATRLLVRRKLLVRIVTPLRHFPVPGNLGSYMHTGLNKFLLFEIWRSWASRRTPYAPLGIPAVLFRSEEHAPEAVYDLGWGGVYQDLRVVPVRGGHSSMFDPANLESVTTAFLAALEAARASACIGPSRLDQT